jgi:putative oxidoreductase
MMFQTLRGPFTVLGRLLLCTIFLLSAVGNKIPHFSDVARIMESAGVPAPQFLLAGAIVFLVVGSLSVILGYRARFGAALLLTFLVLASYYFHPFWKLQGPAQQEQMIQFMKNLSMMGAMLFVVANGAGPLSVDSWLAKPAAPAEKRGRLVQAGTLGDFVTQG